MRLKAALLASLAYRPRLLVLDEPFSGVDPVVRDDLSRGLLAAAEIGETTVLLSSHDIEEVERLADHVALLEGGRLAFAEPTEALLRRFRRIEVETAGGAAAGGRPAAWLAWQEAPGRVTFVDSAYERTATERACRERFPEAAVRAQPLPLREIFVTLARSGRRQPEETLP
jgi:ABC-2 type transport system ATP-binding protein